MRGFSKSRLARLHDAMRRLVERGEVPGLVTLLCRRAFPSFSNVHLDFWTSAYQAIDD